MRCFPIPGAAAAYALSFNPRWRNLIAVGDGMGKVRVWKLGWRLSNPRPKEEQTLSEYVLCSRCAERACLCRRAVG